MRSRWIWTVSPPLLVFCSHSFPLNNEPKVTNLDGAEIFIYRFLRGHNHITVEIWTSFLNDDFSESLETIDRQIWLTLKDNGVGRSRSLVLLMISRLRIPRWMLGVWYEIVCSWHLLLENENCSLLNYKLVKINRNSIPVKYNLLLL